MDIQHSEDLLTKYLSLDVRYRPKERERPKVTPTRYPGLDSLLGGGVPLGYLISVEGHLLTQSGKTGLSLLLSAALQKRGGVLWIDTDQQFNPTHAQNCGLDLSNIALCSIREANQAIRCIEKGVKTPGISCVVLDSIAGLIPKEIPGYDGPQVVRLFSERLELIKALAGGHQTSVILINQYKDGVGQLVGGPATKCQPQIRLRVEDTFGVKHYGVREGLRSTVSSIKNHLVTPFKRWDLNINYQSGPDRALDVFMVAIDKGLIKRRGVWLTYQEESFQGVKELREALGSQVDYLYQEVIKEYAIP